MPLSEYITHYLSAPDSTWSLVSLPFAVTFIVFFGIYILVRQQSKTVMLGYVLTFSLFFAYKANGVLMLLLPFTMLTSYYMTRRMMEEEEDTIRRRWMWATVVLDLLPLAYYKYTNFFISILSDLTSSNFSPLAIILPVGISFYTFQAISYTVDVYKGRFTMEVSLLEYAFYLTFFPLLMAGPITRAETLIPQIKHRYPVNDTQVYTGMWLIMTGLMKKALIADYIAQYNNWIFDDPEAFSGFENFMGVLGYSLQIFCDFSGYSDISIGIASLLGFTLRENFRYPYQSLNLQEFWRRWHISLSTWFRDYLDIPIGGNRKGNARTYLNNFISMLVAGLWHGASWMFVTWGALHGLGQVVHKFCKRWLDQVDNTWYVRLLSWALTFSWVMLCWVFFRSPDMHTAVTIITKIFTDFSWAYLTPFFQTRTVWVVFVALGLGLHAIRERHTERLKQWFIESPITLKVILLFIVMQLVVNFRLSDIQPFIYAQF
ncbi:MAG: MBOAT family protein [Prevotella sp.]|nr:MBOAT family protein [Prevotella sp.]